MRQQIGHALERLRGPLPKAVVAREMAVTRQGVLKLEAGMVSVDRLDRLAEMLGVEFQLEVLVPDDQGELHRLADLDGADAVAPSWKHLLKPAHA